MDRYVHVHPTGTREWSSYSANLFVGCKNNCRYCYARADALRFGLIKDRSDWPNMRIKKKLPTQFYKKVDGVIMFPTTHDIFPETLELTVEYLANVLAAGNQVLIVSKPRKKCIQTIANTFRHDYRNQIKFRFTIGSMQDHVLKFWEPNAPSFGERVACLAYAWQLGYRTSVSCEPFLDDQLLDLYYSVNCFINDSFWIGKMRNIAQRIDVTEWSGGDFDFLHLIQDTHTDEYIKWLYNKMRTKPMVKWKDSIKKVVGLEPEKEDE